MSSVAGGGAVALPQPVRSGANTPPLAAEGGTGQLRVCRDGPVGAEIYVGAGEFRGAATRTAGDPGAERER